MITKTKVISGFVKITSTFRPSDRPEHNGIDFGVMKVPAISDIAGSVSNKTLRVKTLDGKSYTYQLEVWVTNDKEQSRFVHMDSFGVSDGKRIKAGDVVGITGNTGRSSGYHLHFEKRLLINGQWVPVNPADYILLPMEVTPLSGRVQTRGIVDIITDDYQKLGSKSGENAFADFDRIRESTIDTPMGKTEFGIKGTNNAWVHINDTQSRRFDSDTTAEELAVVFKVDREQLLQGFDTKESGYTDKIIKLEAQMSSQSEYVNLLVQQNEKLKKTGLLNILKKAYDYLQKILENSK